MQSQQTSHRELICTQMLGQGISMDYNLQQLQKENSQDSIESQRCQSPKFSELKINVNQSQDISQRYGKLQGPLKLQPSLSRRKIINNPQTPGTFIQVQDKSPTIKNEKNEQMLVLVKRNMKIHRFIALLKNIKPQITELIRLQFEDGTQFQKNNKNNFKESQQKQTVVQNYLYPSSLFIKYWDFISILVNICCFWIILILFSFTDTHYTFTSISMSLIFLFSLCDALIESHRVVIIQGEQIIDKSIIFKNYLSQQLIQDLIQGTCFLLIFSQVNKYSGVNEIITVFQMYATIKKILKKYSHQVHSFYLEGIVNNNLFDLLTIIVSIICFAHVMACIWHYVGQLTLSQENCWLRHYALENESIMVKYNYSFYWATMTMVTVGYGDITPQNQLEMLFANILMLCSTCMFAYSMNSIGLIVKNIYDNKLKYKRSLIQINSYMEKKQVEGTLQDRIRSYIKYSLQQSLDENQEELKQILHGLPENLQEELNQDIQAKVVNKMRILKETFTQQSVKQLGQELEEEQFPPRHLIYSKNNIENQYLYYIEQGEVEIFDEISQKVLQILKPGSCFGYYQFFTGHPTDMAVRSIGITQVFRLDRSKAQKILNFNIRDWELFHLINQKIQLQNDYSALHMKCFYCKSCNHSHTKCPTISYQPSLEFIYKKEYFASIPNDRLKFNRYGEKINSRKLLQEIQSSLEDYQQFQQDQNFAKGGQDNISIDTANQKKRTVTTINSKELEIVPQLKTKTPRNSVIFANKLKITTTNNLQGNDELLNQFATGNSEDIDKIKNYGEYFPHNNIQYIQNLYNNLNQNQEIDGPEKKTIFKYTFSFVAAKLIEKIKRKLKPKKINILSLISCKIKQKK